MKKKISLLLAILMLVTLIPTAFAESKTVDAVKNTKKVTLDGEEVKVGAYDVEGYNYLKLRDIAAILNGKKCQFSVGYDEPTKLISVELTKAYEKVEGDLAEIKDEKAKAIVSVKKILVNGEEKEVKTALINEYNYMQLRDLGSLVGLGVGYDKVNKVIMLKSDAGVKEEAPRYVMIKSKLYKDTGEINKNMTCGTMDGKILTTVDAKEMPKKDNESNFGIGYEYQIGTDGSITVDIDDKCLIFKEVKEEEKTEDKKDEKKDEKKEEVKKEEAKVELVPEDKWTKEEKEWFDTCDNYHDAVINIVSNDLPDDANEVQTAMKTHFTNMLLFSIYGGNIAFEGGAKSIDRRVEVRDGVRYCVADYNYPSGSALRFEASKVGTDDEQLNDSLINSVILYPEKELPEKYQKDTKLICKALIEFYDAVADKDYEKAAKVAKELGIKADAERVKSFEKTARHFAEVVGIEIFGNDYEVEEIAAPYNDPDSDPCVAFKYKDGSSFALYYTDVYEGGIVGSPYSAKFN